jgi:diguanylate cyclase (GGDEF)-like protein
MVLGPLLDLHARIREEDLSANPEGEAVRGNGRDELEQTRQALDGMLTRNKQNLELLAKREADYRQLNAALDQRVTERTRELRAANAALEYRAYHDTLTGLPNRELFHQRLTEALAGQGSITPCLAVMLVGLEEFASVNGIHGYSTGDKVLQSLAERLTNLVPAEASVARFGGDVFAVILPCDEDYRDPSDFAALATRLRALMEGPVELADRNVECLTSVGLSAVNRGGETAESLMAQADIALIHGKRASPERVRVFADWMNDELALELKQITALRRALQTDELYLAYQPQCAADGRWQGVEALVRWQTPDGQHVSPAEFIPIAESTGLINSLGSRVFEEALAQAASWHRAGNPLAVAINLSAIQLRQSDITREIDALLSRHAFPAQWLTVEVTESALMQDLEQGRAVLEQLSNLGVRLAIDDFGTGHSSLAYLARLPVDELKIDKQFVNPIPDDPQSKALCRAIIDMGRALDKRIIAEGVETPAQRDWLAAHGCEAFQGFLFARPAPTATLGWPGTDNDPSQAAIAT